MSCLHFIRLVACAFVAIVYGLYYCWPRVANISCVARTRTFFISEGVHLVVGSDTRVEGAPVAIVD